MADSKITDLTAATTLDDADLVVIVDSADTTTKKLTGANLKASIPYQPSDSDLTAIAALAPSNDDVIQRKAGAWTNRTLAQLISDLAALGTTFPILDPASSPRNVVTAGAASVTPLTLKAAASQTADVLQVKDSTDNLMLAISAAATITTPGTELILEETGDQFGTSRINLRSRNGQNGAIFSTVGLGICDLMISDSIVTRNIRMENRISLTHLSTPELQIGFVPGNENCALVVGDDEVMALTHSSSKVPLRARGTASQTGNIQEWQKDTATLLKVTAEGAIEFNEQSDPAAGAADTARLYARDNGSGKSQLVVRFPTGAVQVLATEP